MLENKIVKSKLRSETPDEVDVYVGSRLRARRNLVGISQKQLGQALGLTFQQIQKYESGINRMGSSRLFQISQALSVPVSYFFEGMPTAGELSERHEFAEKEQELLKGAPGKKPRKQLDILHRRETMDLIRAYYHIHDEKQRRRVFELIRSLAEEETL